MAEGYKEGGPTDCWLWTGGDETAPNRNNKMACVNQRCCNPRHVVSAAKVETATKTEDALIVDTGERNYIHYTDDDMKALLNANNVTYRRNAKRETLIALLRENGI